MSLYASPSPKTKKSLKERIATGTVTTSDFFQPNDMFGTVIPQNGTVAVEGPNFEPHKWWAQVTFKDGKAVKIT